MRACALYPAGAAMLEVALGPEAHLGSRLGIALRANTVAETHFAVRGEVLSHVAPIVLIVPNAVTVSADGKHALQLLDVFQGLFLFHQSASQFTHHSPLLHLIDHLPTQHGKSLLLLWCDGARNTIQNAECAQGGTVVTQQRRSGVKANMRRPGDQRIGSESFVRVSVVHIEHPTLLKAWAQKACSMGVSFTASPRLLLNHCRLASRRVIRAMGESQMNAARNTRSSNSCSGGVSRMS